MSALIFAPMSKRSADRYTAVVGDCRYLVEYRHRLGAWTATVSDADGSHQLGQGKCRAEAQKLAQRHARGRK